MIKARRGPILILGLSNLNLERLREGLPIVFGHEDFDLEGVRTIAIVHGETEAAIADDLKKTYGISAPTVN